MAAGDLLGDLKDAYMTPEQRAARAAGKSSTGPVGRAAGQLPVQSPSLSSLAPRQNSFDVTNTPAKYQPPVSLASLSPGTPATTPQSPSMSAASPGAQLTPQQPAIRPVQSLADAYPTAIGDGRQAIYAGVGANGEASFSGAPSGTNTLRQTFAAPNTPQSQRATSLSDAWQSAPASTSQPRTLADLGSIQNLGDGVGTFSQAGAGDSALAINRFQRANDERQKYQDNQRLNLASARLAQDQNFTVVRDSSRKPSLSDALASQERQLNTQSLQGAVASAQGQIDSGRAGRAADLQQRQSQRLEDAFQLASSPNATPEQQAAYARLSDPTGEKAVARQLAQANIGKAQAETGKLGADARKSEAEAANLAGGLDSQLKREQLDKAQRENISAAQDSSAQKVGALDNARDALKLVSEISTSGALNGITGPINSQTPTISGSSQDLINKALRLQTLLTADNLKLMTGVLTDRDITFLSQIGSGLGIGDRGINGSLEGTQQRLGEITKRLGEKISAYEKNMPAGQQTSGSAPAAPPPPVRVSTPADVAKLPSGSLFIAPDGTTRRKP